MKAYKSYITEAGFEVLKSELDQLWKIDRPAVVQAVAEAAAMGDRSENAEYIYGRKRMREIDIRIAFLRKRLRSVEVRPVIAPAEEGKVVFGAYLKLGLPNGTSMVYQLVGSDETDLKNGKISVASPIGDALMYKKLGDKVEVNTPGGLRVFHIQAVQYEPYQ
ncbi:GreA/GreB family elongation factor [Persicobacter psychrovividus]|uniref:Transcription elongation factor GreA n=1 Tax=Persicobacter psychrovividus TaxID=387638 RepID=A0ABM7VKJ6_9BACT|nr:transcription elongation factor GreB [Persicobacter psychrovividus]